MVYVEMLETVAEGSVPIEFALQLHAAGAPRPRIKFPKGAVVPMHEESAKKYVARKIGKIVKGPVAILKESA